MPKAGRFEACQKKKCSQKWPISSGARKICSLSLDSSFLKPRGLWYVSGERVGRGRVSTRGCPCVQPHGQGLVVECRSEWRDSGCMFMGISPESRWVHWWILPHKSPSTTLLGTFQKALMCILFDWWNLPCLAQETPRVWPRPLLGLSPAACPPFVPCCRGFQ